LLAAAGNVGHGLLSRDDGDDERNTHVANEFALTPSEQ
jgi:hypothetical protein